MITTFDTGKPLSAELRAHLSLGLNFVWADEPASQQEHPMESRWNFTPGRVAALYFWGFILGASAYSAILGRPGVRATAFAAVGCSLLTVYLCRTKRGNIAHPS